MELKDIITVSISSLIVITVAHIVIFWVIRTLYPPAPAPAPAQAPAPVYVPPAPTFIEPPSIEQQNVTLPTYEAPVLPKPISKEELRTGPPPAEATAIQRDTGVAMSNS